MTVDLDGIRAATAAGADLVRHTPVLSSRTLSERCGGTVVFKAESLQRTGSFKLRGALSKIAALGPAGCSRGLVAGSAGNHALGLAYAARARGVPCEVIVPADAPIGKVEAVRALGARVAHVDGTVDDAVLAAREEASRPDGPAFVHPFDDEAIVCGQGTLGVELAEEITDLRLVVVPVGGGGLVSGVATALHELAPAARVVGVEVEGWDGVRASLAAGERIERRAAASIADGIAVKRPGDLTLRLIQERVDEIVTVAEDDVAEAMVHLLERAKLVVEGAGAVGIAALMTDKVKPAAEGTTAVVLSGGNVDAGLLAAVARRHETEVGRRLVLRTRIPDRPGQLARMLACVAEAGGNVLAVEHLREGVSLHVRETGVQLVLETRGREHADAVVAAMEEAGYPAEVS